MEGMQGVEFITVNTDAQALMHSQSNPHPHRQQLQGPGLGRQPGDGPKAARGSHRGNVAALKGSDMVFITAGMGGAPGAGAAPAIAGVAQDLGSPDGGRGSPAVHLKGDHRRKTANQGIEQLKPMVDAAIIIPNDRLLQTASKNTSMLQAFPAWPTTCCAGASRVSRM